jgi:hypothetical protein
MAKGGKLMKKIKYVALLTVSLLLASCQATLFKTQGAIHRVGRLRVGTAYDVHVEGGYAYVTNNDGVVIVDVQNPRKPKKVGEIHVGTTFGVFVKDDLAYVAGGGELLIADVSDPGNPKVLGAHRDGKVANQVRVDGSYAYVTGGSDGFKILDISDPSKPLEVASFDEGGEGFGVEVENGIVYFADPRHGLTVIDATDPRSPQKIKTVPETEGAWGVYVHGELLYVGCHGKGVKIIGIGGDKSLQVIGTYYDGDGEEMGMWGDGEHLYVADNHGVEVLNVSDPAAPYEVGQLSGARLSLSPAVHDVSSDGEFIYLADGLGGLIVLRFAEDP